MGEGAQGHSRTPAKPCHHIHGATECSGERPKSRRVLRTLGDMDPSPRVAKQRQDQRAMEVSMAEQMKSPLANGSQRRTYERENRS